jgi:hypothetical protein
MADSTAAAGFDPAKEFPNIVWNFDNLADPATVADAPEGPEVEPATKGLITAPPTPPVAALVSTPAAASVHRSANKAASSAKSKRTPAKHTPAKRQALALDGSVREKAKAGKSTPKSASKEVQTAVLLPPTTSAENKAASRMARTQARKEQKRERRREKRRQARSQAQPTAQEPETTTAPQEQEP